MTEHTPGPCQVVMSEDGEEAHVCAVPRGLIATLEAWMEDPKEAPRGEADARLIAASPELLEACQYLCAEIHNGCDRRDETFMRGVGRAEGIIAKAEGESPNRLESRESADE